MLNAPPDIPLGCNLGAHPRICVSPRERDYFGYLTGPAGVGVVSLYLRDPGVGKDFVQVGQYFVSL